MTPFVVQRRVEFCETDMAGMVHFSNFFRYMEFAEQEFLRNRGLSVTWQIDGRRFGLPRVAASCDYLKPARFEQVLSIAVAIERIGRKSLTYGFEFRHLDEVIARGRITAVCCREVAAGEIESIEIPADVRAKLDAT